MKRFKILWALTAMFFIIAPAFDDSTAVEPMSQSSLVFINKPLVDAISEINQQFDYQVILNERCGNPDVSGDFSGLPIEKIFNKLLRENSAAVLVDEKSQNIQIDCVGQNRESVSRVPISTGKRVLEESSDPEIRMLEEVEKTNPTSSAENTKADVSGIEGYVDPMTGLTIREMEKQMNVQLQ